MSIPGAGPYAGQTAIKGPFAGISNCFLTAQRAFSTDPDASARLHHGVRIDVAAGTFTFRLKGAASNGCFTGAPDIDWDLPVTLTVASGDELLTARVDGKLDKFPAFEMYVSTNGQTAVPLFQKAPPPGNTPFDLPGEASEPIQGEKQPGAIFNGLWKSNDAPKRFELTVSGTAVQWLERRPSGATLTRPATVTPVAPTTTTFRIERANDNAVLQFLYFPDAFLRQEILAANPEPSYLLLTRQGNKLIGEWHGLLVKKPNGHLDSIGQPKDMVGKSSRMQ